MFSIVYVIMAYWMTGGKGVFVASELVEFPPEARPWIPLNQEKIQEEYSRTSGCGREKGLVIELHLVTGSDKQKPFITLFLENLIRV